MTNVHEFSREEVMAYLDGELSGVAAESAQAHLETCAECRDMAAGFRHVTGQLGEWQVEPAPAELHTRVVPPVPTTEPSRDSGFGQWLRWPRLAFAGAGAVILATGLILSGNWTLPEIGRPGGQGQSESVLSERASVGSEVAAPTHRAEFPQPVPAPPASMPFALAQEPGLPAQPMVIRIVTLRLSTEKFDEVRPSIEQLIAAHGGRIGSLSVAGERNRRSLSATLRVPSARVDAFVAALRPLGQVQQEAISTEEVTSEYQDLSIRIATAKREEQRLIGLLTNRTGKLAEVLEVEREIARVRTDIERMDAALRARKDQVDFSSVNLGVAEAYRAEMTLAPLSVGARLRNAGIDGIRHAADGLIDVALAIVELTPMVILWILVLAWPVRLLLRRARAWRRV